VETLNAKALIYRQFGFGGDRQTLYVGTVPRTYQIGSSENPTGLWVVVDGDGGHPIPTDTVGGLIQVTGRTIYIEYRTSLTRSANAYWNDVPAHPVLGPGGAGFNTVNQAAINQVVWNNISEDRVYRFTSDMPAPSGLWVRRPGAEDQPIPTLNTYIDVGGGSLTIIAEGRAVTETRVAYWRDIT